MAYMFSSCTGERRGRGGMPRLGWRCPPFGSFVRGRAPLLLDALLLLHMDRECGGVALAISGVYGALGGERWDCDAAVRRTSAALALLGQLVPPIPAMPSLPLPGPRGASGQGSGHTWGDLHSARSERQRGGEHPRQCQCRGSSWAFGGPYIGGPRRHAAGTAGGPAPERGPDNAGPEEAEGV